MLARAERASDAFQVDSPEKSSVAVISFPELESDEVRAVAAAWQKWRGSRTVPLREQVSPRDLGVFAVNTSLVRVLDNGADYEFRVIGDAHVQAYGTSYQGKKISDVIADSPRFGRQLKASYEVARATRKPYAIRGLIGRDMPDARFVWFETAYFPIGTDDTIDHILNAAVYRPRNGI